MASNFSLIRLGNCQSCNQLWPKGLFPRKYRKKSWKRSYKYKNFWHNFFDTAYSVQYTKEDRKSDCRLAILGLPIHLRFRWRAAWRAAGRSGPPAESAQPWCAIRITCAWRPESLLVSICCVLEDPWRMINTEEKATVVAVLFGGQNMFNSLPR